jgi:hypothetical protein
MDRSRCLLHRIPNERIHTVVTLWGRMLLRPMRRLCEYVIEQEAGQFDEKSNALSLSTGKQQSKEVNT